jgi:hypothetical protein
MELANMIIRDNDDAQDCEMIRLDFTDTFINDLWISNITVINAGVNMVKSNKGPMYFRVENLKASTNWQVRNVPMRRLCLINIFWAL